MARKIGRYVPPVHYSQAELTRASLRDLARDIRCARRDNCEANPLLAYADKCATEFRAMWPTRHGGYSHPFDSNGLGLCRECDTNHR